MESESCEPSGGCCKKKMVKHKVKMAKSIITRYSKRPNLRSRRRTQYNFNENLYSTHDNDTVDFADLIFSPERDFLIKNNGQKVRVDDLKGKTIVLYIVPLYEFLLKGGHILDMIEAYSELLPLGGVEFVFVPAYLDQLRGGVRSRDPPRFASQEALYNHLFSTMPFPAVPFSDIESCGGCVVKTFSVDNFLYYDCLEHLFPYWVVIDHTGTVVAKRVSYPYLFKFFGGAELHPLSLERIETLSDEHRRPTYRNRWESRKGLINKWDQLLASPTRDYLLSSNRDQVPISSLKDKVIGLYFCENMAHPRNMGVIKKVYQEAKSCGYNFEIVQINFHYHFLHTHIPDTVDMSVQQCNESVNWLTLPFKDPCCRKLQRIFPCSDDDEDNEHWYGDSLVIIDPREADDINGVLFEFSGAEIFRKYGIEAYPFTRQYLYEVEYAIQEEKGMKLQWFFPPGLCHLIRPSGDGFDLTDGSELIGKRVLVLFGEKRKCERSAFVSMLKSKYSEQDEAEENKFEVVHVSTDYSETFFIESIKDMPWLVHPYCEDLGSDCGKKMMKLSTVGGIGAAAFDVDGELIAKECYWDRDHNIWENPELDKLHFPFISQDRKKRIQREVAHMCQLYRYYYEE